MKITDVKVHLVESWRKTRDIGSPWIFVQVYTDEGVVGVKVLGPGDKVAFKPVRILDSDETGVWLADLPEDVILITVGQEFVQDGQVVVPIDETTLQPLVRDLSS